MSETVDIVYTNKRRENYKRCCLFLIVEGWILNENKWSFG